VGKKLEELFAKAGKLDGLVGRMRLASLARITSGEASTLPDTPERVRRLSQALERVSSELKDAADPGTTSAPYSSSRQSNAEERNEKLRRYLSSYADLLSQRRLFLNDPAATARRITEVASSVLGVQRASLWASDEQRRTLTCTNLFQAQPATHESGLVLEAADYANYFRALLAERTIAAHDARNDPRTSCFAEGYLKPLGITAMLDVPVWASGVMVGVLCLEHVGGPRTWTDDEETFAYLLSSLASLAIEGSTKPA